jgi:Ca2+-binding RTX toxin-like protein
MSGGSNEDTLSLSDGLDTGMANLSVASIYNQGGSISYDLGTASSELYQDQAKVVSIDKLQLANGSNKVLLGAKSQRALTDEVIGGSQSDVILADSGVFKSLKLDGGDSSDMLGGGSGNDSLVGGNGNDTLIAGAGVDTMIGGAGTDKFRIDSSQFRNNDSIDGGTNVGGVDVLELWGKSSVNDGVFANSRV